MGADNRVMKTYDEVSLHNSLNDCWVIINAKAYNVTNFLNDHPGGDEVLLAAAGKDASEEFEESGHGSAARLMLDEFYVGEIDPSTKATTVSTTTISSTNFLEKQHIIDHYLGKSSRQNVIKLLLQFLVPIVILGLASTLYLSSCIEKIKE